MVLHGLERGSVQVRADARIEALKNFACMKLSYGLECLVGVLSNCVAEVFVSGVSHGSKIGQAQRLTKALQRAVFKGSRDLMKVPS